MNRRILVVDDESIVAHDISECLIHMGCEVVGTALSGPDAIDKATRFRPDLIMMDIVLQGPMDGVDAATEIRRLLDIPCVFLTAYSDPAVLARAKAASPAGYMVKPFEEAGLRSTVEIALYKVDLERALRESNEWFMTTLMSIGDGVVATGPDGRVRFMNPLAEALTGWNSSDAAGKWIEEIFPIRNEYTGEPVENPVLRALREKALTGLDKGTVLLRNDGARIPIDDSAAPIRNNKNEVVGGVLVFRDITERRKVELEVRRYQNHLEELVTERTAEIRQTNARLLAEVEERRRAETALARRMRMETLLARQSAAFLRLRPGETGEGLHAALGELASCLHAMRCYLMLPDRNGASLTCRDEWSAEHVPSLKDTFRNVPASALPPPRQHSAGRGAVILSNNIPEGPFPQLAAARGAASTVWLRMLDGDSAAGYLCADREAGSPPWEEDDVTLLAMMADLLSTALGRWRAEEEKSRLQSQLQQSLKMEAVGKLSGGIAHDFNNMLLPIIGYSDMVLSRLTPEDPSAVELNEIRRAAEQAASLTRQLLAFSRKQVVKKMTFDLNEKLRLMHRMLCRIIGEDVRLEMELSEGTLTLTADSGQVEQVLMNLCINARDAMPDGGAITLSTAIVTSPPRQVPLLGNHPPSGRYAHISVKDTGCGIPEENHGRIFEPFFTTKGMEGTGLGLSVIYGIIQEHQGGLAVDSAANQGTTFHIFLPAVTAEPAPPQGESGPPAAAAAAPRGTGQRVLLVEDEESVNRLVLTALTQNGYQVTTAFCVKEALDQFDRHSGEFDMIFSDAVLPDGNGLQLLDTFLTRNPALRFLLSSGYTDRDSLMQLAKQRHISFLPKPYSLPTLFRTVADVMHDQNAHRLL